MSRIGVVIPHYNHTQYLGEALSSVAWQSVKAHSVIVVDDCSDDFPGVMEAIRDAPQECCVIRAPQNMGVSVSRNVGIQHLIREGCDLILPLDADDVLERTMIEEGLKVLQQGYHIAYPDCTFFGARRGLARFPERNTLELLEALCRGNEIVNSSLFRKEVYEAVRAGNGEGYDPALKEWGWEDWLFWLEALILGFRAKGIRKTLLRYRIHESSRVTRSNEKGGLCWEYFQQKLKGLYGVKLGERNVNRTAEGSLLGGVRRKAGRHGLSELSIR